MTNEDPIPKVAIQPLDCLTKSKELIGDQYWLFFAIALVAVLIMGVLPIILQGPLYCGIYLCFLARERGERVQFERLFKGFDVFVESLVATLIFLGVTLVVSLPFVGVMLGCFIGGGAALDDHNEALGTILLVLGGLVTLVFTIVCFVLTVWFALVYPLIIDRKLSALDAVRTSFAAGRRNFGGLLGLTLLNGLIALVLSLACYVPVFLFLPIAFGSTWIAYRKVFPAQPVAQPDRDETALDVPGIA